MSLRKSHLRRLKPAHKHELTASVSGSSRPFLDVESRAPGAARCPGRRRPAVPVTHLQAGLCSPQGCASPCLPPRGRSPGGRPHPDSPARGASICPDPPSQLALCSPPPPTRGPAEPAGGRVGCSWLIHTEGIRDELGFSREPAEPHAESKASCPASWPCITEDCPGASKHQGGRSLGKRSS